MTLQIQAGKYYKRRDGQVTGPMGLNPLVDLYEYPFLDPYTDYTYTETGRYHKSQELATDLISECNADGSDITTLKQDWDNGFETLKAIQHAHKMAELGPQNAEMRDSGDMEGGRIKAFWPDVMVAHHTFQKMQEIIDKLEAENRELKDKHYAAVRCAGIEIANQQERREAETDELKTRITELETENAALFSRAAVELETCEREYQNKVFNLEAENAALKEHLNNVLDRNIQLSAQLLTAENALKELTPKPVVTQEAVPTSVWRNVYSENAAYMDNVGALYTSRAEADRKQSPYRQRIAVLRLDTVNGTTAANLEEV